MLAGLLLSAVVCCHSVRKGVQFQPPDDVASETLLASIVAECAKRQNTTLMLDADGSTLVTSNASLYSAPCNHLDIALRGLERGVGMCTDVALYVLHARARIVPLPVGDDRQQYDKRCGATTVRMSLETMYPSWFTNHSLASHVMLVSQSHVPASQALLEKG